MRHRANKDEILSVLKREGSEVFESDIDLMYDLLSEYYYNGINFNVVKSTNPSGAYQAMTTIKRNAIKGVFGDRNSVSIDVKKFTANEEYQLRHRKDMMEDAVMWMKSNYRYDSTRTRVSQFISHLESHSYKNNFEAFDIDMSYSDLGYGHSKSKQFNELLTTDMAGNFTDDFMESQLWNLTKDMLGDTYQFGDHKVSMMSDAVDFIEGLTEEEIKNNTIKKEIRIRGKRYGKGAKLTRVLAAMKEMNYMQYKVADEFNLQAVTDEIFLTANIIGAPVAGIISDSCFSPAGSNSYSNINSINYPEVVWAFTENLDWRCILTFDEIEKRVAIHNGYPTNKIQNIRAIQYFLESKGYEVVNSEYFDYDEVEYWSYDSPIRKDDQGELDSSYTVSSNYTEKPTLTTASNRVTVPAFDIGDNTLTIWSDDEHSMEYCDICDDYHMNVVYIGDYSRCESCANYYLQNEMSDAIDTVRNTTIINEIRSMDRESTIEDIHNKIIAIDDYIVDQSYSIVGLTRLPDWDGREFPLSDSEFKSSMEEGIGNGAKYYDCPQIDAADFEGVFSDEMSLALDDYFSTKFENSIFNETMTHSDMADIAERLTEYIFN